MDFLSNLFNSSKTKTKEAIVPNRYNDLTLKQIKVKAREAESNDDYDLAIDLLTQGKRLYENLNDYFILPKVLQRAGKMELAILDIENTIKAIPYIVKKQSPHLTYLQYVSSIFNAYSDTFNAMRIFTKNTEEKNLYSYSLLMSIGCELIGGKYRKLPYWINLLDIEVWRLELLPNTTNRDYIKNICIRFIEDLDLIHFESDLSASLNIQQFKLEAISDFASQPLSNQNEYKKRLYFLSESGQMFLDSAMEYWKVKDFNNARIMFTKVGYAIKTMETESTKYNKRQIFKHKKKILEVQMEFAFSDPLYQSMIRKVHIIIAKSPGILQTEIYKKLDYDKTDIMYVLYYADKLNDIKRNKKGRTYELIPIVTYLSDVYNPDLDKLEKIDPYFDI